MIAKTCPLVGECIEHRCTWWTHIIGSNPQTGAAVDEFGCAVAMLPMLMIETSRAAHSTAQQVSDANETQKQALRSAMMGRPSPELARLLGVQHV